MEQQCDGYPVFVKPQQTISSVCLLSTLTARWCHTIVIHSGVIVVAPVSRKFVLRLISKETKTQWVELGLRLRGKEHVVS